MPKSSLKFFGHFIFQHAASQTIENKVISGGSFGLFAQSLTCNILTALTSYTNRMYSLPNDPNNMTSNARFLFQICGFITAFSCEKLLEQEARAMPCHAWVVTSDG